MTELLDAGKQMLVEGLLSWLVKNFGFTLKFLTQDQKPVYTARLR